LDDCKSVCVWVKMVGIYEGFWRHKHVIRFHIISYVTIFARDCLVQKACELNGRCEWGKKGSRAQNHVGWGGVGWGGKGHVEGELKKQAQKKR